MERPDRLPRKLAAILYADVAGYSRLTGKDEDATQHHPRQSLDQISPAIEQISPAIEQYEGRVVHYAGDAVLADFGTLSNALSCASAVQETSSPR